MDKYLIDGHKLFWHLDRVTEWQRGNAVSPIYVEISPVSLCNHKCIFCAIDFVRDKDFKLDTDIFCDRLKEMGSLGVRSVMFAGEGEPLLHGGLSRFIRTAKSSGMDVSLTTNGSLGNYKIWKELLPSLTWIRFSVDAGNAESYSRVHKVGAGVFDKVVASIKDAVKVKRDLGLGVTIGVQFLMIEENLKSLEEALKLFSGIGVDYFSLKPYSLHPQMVNKRDTFYTGRIAGRIGRAVEKFRKSSKMNIVFRDTAMEKYARKEKQFKHCRALPFWGYVSSKGDFYTCSVFIGDKRFKAGNVHKEGMRKIFFGKPRADSIAYAVKRLPVNKECRVNCRMARVNEFLEFLENRPEHINFV
ncbi:MAG: radical SAM protein [Candidatus Omnitrophica bacterium]|nr:radical SAM protein [Candidatus Omnitrophota bacterium]